MSPGGMYNKGLSFVMKQLKEIQSSGIDINDDDIWLNWMTKNCTMEKDTMKTFDQALI